MIDMAYLMTFMGRDVDELFWNQFMDEQRGEGVILFAHDGAEINNPEDYRFLISYDPRTHKIIGVTQLCD